MRQAREQRKLTAEDVASSLGCSVRTVARMEESGRGYYLKRYEALLDGHNPDTRGRRPAREMSLDNATVTSENPRLEDKHSHTMAHDGKPIPEHFRRYHRLLETLAPEQLIRVMEAEREVYDQLQTAYPDPKARLSESVRIALKFLESIHEEERADSE